MQAKIPFICEASNSAFVFSEVYSDPSFSTFERLGFVSGAGTIFTPQVYFHSTLGKLPFFCLFEDLINLTHS